jgi:hypothetical protein
MEDGSSMNWQNLYNQEWPTPESSKHFKPSDRMYDSQKLKMPAGQIQILE